MLCRDKRKFLLPIPIKQGSLWQQALKRRRLRLSRAGEKSRAKQNRKFTPPACLLSRVEFLSRLEANLKEKEKIGVGGKDGMNRTISIRKDFVPVKKERLILCRTG